MSEQLDWLARVLHKWPRITPKVISAGDALFEFGANFYDDDSADIYGKFAGCGVTVTKQQWLDRRAELQNKPSFADHPDAKCFVQNADGQWAKNTKTDDVIPTTDDRAWKWNGPVAGGGWAHLGKGEVLGDWRDTLEKRPADRSEQAGPQEAADNVLAAVPELKSGHYKFEDAQPLTRDQALQWTVDNVDWWYKAPLGPWPTPSGWSWEQACGNIYLMQVGGEPCIGEMEWERAKREQTTGELNTMLEGSGFEPFTGLEDAQQAPHGAQLVGVATALHTVHRAAFLHHGCQLLLSEPELVVFRTADGELIHCKPKECLIDPDVYGLAARLLADMSGHPVAPEHMRELVEQMNWRVE